MDHRQASVRSLTALLNQSTDTDEEKSDITDHNEDRKVSDTESHSDIISEQEERSEDVELNSVKSLCDNGGFNADITDASEVINSINEVNDTPKCEHHPEKNADHHVRFAGETEVVQLGIEFENGTSDNAAEMPKGTESAPSETKAAKPDTQWREAKTKVFVGFLFVLIICGVTLIYHLYHLKLRRMTKDKKLVYNIDISTIKFYNRKHNVILTGVLGADLQMEKFPRYCDKLSKSNLHGEIYEELCLTWLNLTDLKVTYNHSDTVTCYDVSWQSHSSNFLLHDCYDLGDGHWYGMGLVHNQEWPINSHSVGKIPFLIGMVYNSQSLGSVIQPYWLNSKGVSIIVDSDVPLHISFNSPLGQSHANDTKDITDNRLCLYGDFKGSPYLKRSYPHLKYSVCVGENLVDVHRVSLKKFSPVPPTVPDLSIITNPVWSTIPFVSRNLTQASVRTHYNNIINRQYKHGIFLLDGGWQETLGELVFNQSLFNDPASMIQDIKSDDFQMVLSTDPYLSYSSKAFRDAISQDLLVHSVSVPGLTRWWFGEPSSTTWYHMVGVVDMFPEAQYWLSSRLLNLSQAFKIDGFYWKGGQMDVQPYNPNFRANLSSPNEYVLKMAELGMSLGGINIQQSAFNSQHVPMWLRLYGRQSTWKGDAGLQSVIPSVLTLGLLGYPFILSDVIGGNAYSSFPSKELYIRWLELTAFLPTMHFSIPPNYYDSETEEVANDMIKMHQSYVAPLVYRIIKKLQSDRRPIIRPLWMIAPDDPNTLTISDQFMIGDDVMVAPVVEEDQRKRDIYVPAGIWYNKLHDYFVQGPKWLRSISVPLKKIAYFERKPFHP